jgi:hypothetical protein
MATPTGGGGGLSSSEVLAYAERLAQSGTNDYVNLCQRFVREAFGSSGGASTASEAWSNTPIKHTKGTPPPGTAVYWGGGAGHAAISAGNGWVYTTDWSAPGRISLARIDDITNKWGKPLLGWTTQTNERKIQKMDAVPVEGKGADGIPTYTTAGGGVATGYSKAELKKRYGYIASVYESVPEIQKLVKQAVAGGWTPDEFDRRFQDTGWYRKHTEEERQYVLKLATEPRETAQTVNQKEIELRNLYRQLGIPVAPKRLAEIAQQSVKHGWTPQQERNALVAEFDYNPDNTFGGAAGQTVDEFRRLASEYVVPLSNRTLEKWTENVLRNEGDTTDFVSFLKDRAKSQWDDPNMQAAIDRGMTVNEYLDPHREAAARTLGISADEVNWQDPKWQQAVFQTDDKGGRKVMSIADWNRTIRTDPRFGYDKTPEALGQGASLISKLSEVMGV